MESHVRISGGFRGQAEILGLSCASELPFGKKLRYFDPKCARPLVGRRPLFFLMSKVVREVSRTNNGWFDEFLVEDSESREFFRETP